MYFWKCWRDTRLRFFFYLSLYVGLTVLWIVLAGRDARLQSVPRPNFWPMLMLGAWFYGFPLSVLIGLGLGSIGVGAELGTGSAEFLLTRPSSRRHFVWVSWIVGIGEILVVLTVVSLIAMAALRYKLGPGWQHVGALGYRGVVPVDLRINSFDVLCVLLLSFSVTAALTHGLTYFLSVFTRSGQRALNYSASIILAYWIGSALVAHWTRFHLPSLTGTALLDFGTRHQYYSMFLTGTSPFPMVGRALLTLAFPFAAQFLLDRAEV